MDRVSLVHVIGDDAGVASSLTAAQDRIRFEFSFYETTSRFLAVAASAAPGCVLANVRMQEMGGTELLRRMHEIGCRLPAIFIADVGDVAGIIDVMRMGALDVLVNPLDIDRLREALDAADTRRRTLQRDGRDPRAASRVASLSPRCRDVLDGLAQGLSSKDIARKLGISPRTIEVHRANMLQRLGVKRTAEAIRMAIEANIPHECRLCTLTECSGDPVLADCSQRLVAA